MINLRQRAIIAGLALAFATNAATISYEQATARAKWIDLNKDGVLDANEIAAAKHKYGKEVDTIRIGASDANRDGRISISEAVNARAFGEWTRTTTINSNRGTSTVVADGNSWKTDDGRAWEVNRDGTNSKGVNWNSNTTGQAQKTDAGAVWSSHSVGATDNGNRTWETDRNGERIVNEDGTISLSKEFEKTLGNGAVITGEQERTITKTDDGREWESEGSRVGPNGETTWTGSGVATRTEDGHEVVIDREGTRNGEEFTKHVEATVNRENGKTVNRESLAAERAQRIKQHSEAAAQKGERIVGLPQYATDKVAVGFKDPQASARGERQAQARDRVAATKDRQPQARDRAAAGKDRSRPTRSSAGASRGKK